MTRLRGSRVIAILALVGGWVALMLAIFGGGAGYVVHARFIDAGQLVNGDLVEVGGIPVGKVSGISLTQDAQADVALKITDSHYDPLPGGTTASIRAVGLSGVANRYVALTPGAPGAPPIGNGGVIDMAQTQPIVDLDSVLDSLDPKTRRRLQGLVRGGAASLRGVSGAGGRALRYLDPALSQTAALTGEIARDQLAFQRLVTNASAVASTLAARHPALERSVTSTAAALRQIATQRTAVGDILARAPGILRHSSRTLLDARRTLQVVPAALPLVRILRAFGPGLRRSAPLVANLRASLPELRRAFASLPGIARKTVPLARKTTRSVRGALPIFRTTRPYVPDFINGFFNGLAGGVGGYSDANGDYVRIAPLQGSGGIFGTSPLAPPSGLGGLVQYRTGLLARCPGAAVEPATDSSNPWIPSASLCDPAESHR